MDTALIESLALPGMHPAKQERSRRLALSLIETALTMLHDCDFDGLSLVDLCARTGVTVGAFYSRFESKDAFLHAVQQAVVEDSRRGIEASLTLARRGGDDLPGFLDWLVHGAVVWARRHEGLVRASLRHAQTEPGSWSPMRELGALRVARTVPIIRHILDREGRGGDARETEDAIRFAFQMLYGTLNNMILVNPGPFGLHDPQTPRLLSRALLLMVEQAAGPA